MLAAGALHDPRCDMGLIVATGTNLAVAVPGYMILKDVPTDDASGEMLFNMECGNFSNVQSVQSRHDLKLDAESDTEGQLLEKMISGRYLGEIVRLTVAHLAERGEGFLGWLRQRSVFREPYSFSTEYISDIAYDTSPELTATGILLHGLGVTESTEDDRRNLRELCLGVGRRSARLVAMSIVATATYVDSDLEREHLVAADGSLVPRIPRIRGQCGVRNL